ncbi:MAG: polysaccharide deacetylase family protein, partial [Bdellovibrionales bacterium]|nr:polysaccharide deacetylase family protein [Bdellovibrionales bacterium]
IITFILIVPLFSNAQEVAITIDDAPMSNSYLTGPQRSQKIIEALRKHKAKAIFFTNSNKLHSPERKSSITNYGNAGHYIANHTHSHKHASKVSADEYIKEIKEADKVLSQYPNFKLWFRFPYLDQSKSHEKRGKIFSWLDKSNYKVGYVTIDNWDWYINSLLQKSLEKGKKVDFEKLKQLYVDYIIECSEYYHTESKKYFSKPIQHSLLIHENDLTALFLDDLLNAYKNKGWKIVDPKEVMNQKAFQEPQKGLRNGDGIVAARIYQKFPDKKRTPLTSYEWIKNGLRINLVLLNELFNSRADDVF